MARKKRVKLGACVAIATMLLAGCTGFTGDSATSSEVNPDTGVSYTLKEGGKRLEPEDGKVLHGAGQDMGSFMLYCNALDAQTQPIISMYYTGLRDDLSMFFKGVSSDLMDYGEDVIPQIGLYMTVDGSPEMAFDDEVAAGQTDANINILVDELKKLGAACFSTHWL